MSRHTQQCISTLAIFAAQFVCAQSPNRAPDSEQPQPAMGLSSRVVDISPVYCGRVVTRRRKLVHAYGGSDESEVAVLRGLRWLKNHQASDGSWSESRPVAMAGLGVLAFLAHGETPTEEEFGTTVAKAIHYLSTQMLTTNIVKGCGGRAYTHGIATLALTEAYALTGKASLKPAVERGLQRIIAGQQKTGGFDYRYARGKRWDLSISGWQYQALRAGSLVPVKCPGLRKALQRGYHFFRTVSHREGKFGYSSPGKGSWAMQGAGAFCLQLLGAGATDECQAALSNLAENYNSSWQGPEPYSSPSNPAYTWYYITNAMFWAGEPAWSSWNALFARQLVASQHPDGHWECPGPVKKGEKRPEYDPYYTTSLCCLCLETYYRYVKQ